MSLLLQIRPRAGGGGCDADRTDIRAAGDREVATGVGESGVAHNPVRAGVNANAGVVASVVAVDSIIAAGAAGAKNPVHAIVIALVLRQDATGADVYSIAVVARKRAVFDRGIRSAHIDAHALKVAGTHCSVRIAARGAADHGRSVGSNPRGGRLVGRSK